MLVALGLTLIYGVLVQINFAHADVVTIGAFAAYFFMHLSAAATSLQHRRRACGRRRARLADQCGDLRAACGTTGNELLPLIATIGVSVMMQNVMLAWFGPIPYAFETPYSNQVIRFAGIFVSWQNVIIIVVSTLTIALALCLHEVHLSRQGAARGLAGPRNRGPHGHQSQSAHHADVRDRLGARRHGRRDARRRCWCSRRLPARP